MEIYEAKSKLAEILSKEGFRVDNPDPRTAWAGFKAFVIEPVNCAHDGVLFECGVSNSWTGKDQFYFDFVRQFTIEVDGDYDHMEQLHCLFSRPPTDDVRRLSTNLWLEGFGGDHGAYFAAAEALSEFQKGMQLTGWTSEILQHVV